MNTATGKTTWKNFITPLEANNRLGDYVIIDCRGDLIDHDAGRQAYAKLRIKGALYLDVHTDLTGPVGIHGGRHPLPKLDEFVGRLESMGITAESSILIYDDWIFAAARLWWMLKYIGIENVKVLAGGLKAWEAAGLPVDKRELNLSADEESLALPLQDIPGAGSVPASLCVNINSDRQIRYEDLKAAIGTGEYVLVDSRAAARYRGETEPMDRVAGHIPTAINVYYEEAYTANGLKDRAELERIFSPLVAAEKQLVVYCGSGISAPINILAMTEIDLDPILYVGSWSDWVSYKESEIAKGEEHIIE